MIGGDVCRKCGQSRAGVMQRGDGYRHCIASLSGQHSWPEAAASTSVMNVTSHNQQGGVTAGVVFDPSVPAPQPTTLYDPRPLLDHGYLQLVEAWGSDQRIIESARQSTDKGFLGWSPYSECRGCGLVVQWIEGVARPTNGCLFNGIHDWREVPEGDLGLLRYLWKNKHSTPFEFAGLTVEVQAPIFVFREWHRHRVPFGYSELSARYAPMPNLNYVPTVERCMTVGGHITKQAGSQYGTALTDAAAESWLSQLEQLYEHSQSVYQLGLDVGIPKELARLAVTVGRYSRMRATGNLRGWLAFLALRNAPTAQYEIRVFAEQIAAVLHETFPRTCQVAL